MILETSWGTATGWMIVRDVLLIGPWHHDDDRSATYRRTPERLRGRAHPAAHDPLRLRRGADDHGLRAGARLRPLARALGVHRQRLPPGPRLGRRAPTCELTLTTDMLLGFEGGQASARTLLKAGRHPVRRAVVGWRRAADDLRGGLPASSSGRRTTGSTGWPAGSFPDHPWRSYLQRSALTLKGLTYSPTGAVDRRRQRPRSRRRRAATATTTTGSPGSATRPSPCGGCTPSASTGRPSTSSPSSPTSPSGDDDLQIMYGIGGERDLDEDELDHLPGYAELPAGADRQRGVRPEAARRLGRPARLASTCTPRPPTTSTTGSGRSSTSRWARRSSTGASPTPASGRCAASTGTSPPPRSCAGSRSTAAPGWPG